MWTNGEIGALSSDTHACCDGSGDLICAAQHKWATVSSCRNADLSLHTCLPFLWFMVSAWVESKTNKKTIFFFSLCFTVTAAFGEKVPSHVQSAGICWVSNEKVHECQHYPIVQPHCATWNLDFRWKDSLWITFIASTYFWLLVHVCIWHSECDKPSIFFLNYPAVDSRCSCQITTFHYSRHHKLFTQHGWGVLLLQRHATCVQFEQPAWCVVILEHTTADATTCFHMWTPDLFLSINNTAATASRPRVLQLCSSF